MNQYKQYIPVVIDPDKQAQRGHWVDTIQDHRSQATYAIVIFKFSKRVVRLDIDTHCIEVVSE